MKKLLILALLVCLGGCEQENLVAVRQGEAGKFFIYEHCINGYVFYTRNGGGITQVMELVDGVTRPKMCEEVK